MGKEMKFELLRISERCVTIATIVDLPPEARVHVPDVDQSFLRAGEDFWTMLTFENRHRGC